MEIVLKSQIINQSVLSKWPPESASSSLFSPSWLSADHILVQKYYVVGSVLSQQHEILRTVMGFTAHYSGSHLPKTQSKPFKNDLSQVINMYRCVYVAPGPEPTDGYPAHVDKVRVFMGLTL